MGENCKRKALTLEDKIEIIKKFEEDHILNQAEYAKKLNIPTSTLSTILSNKEEIFKLAGTYSLKTKKLKLGKYQEIEEELYEWFGTVRSSNIPVNGSIIREKAKEIAIKYHTEFSASNGWIDRFKKRFGLYLRK